MFCWIFAPPRFCDALVTRLAVTAIPVFSLRFAVKLIERPIPAALRASFESGRINRDGEFHYNYDTKRLFLSPVDNEGNNQASKFSEQSESGTIWMTTDGGVTYGEFEYINLAIDGVSGELELTLIDLNAVGLHTLFCKDRHRRYRPSCSAV